MCICNMLVLENSIRRPYIFPGVILCNRNYEKWSQAKVNCEHAGGRLVTNVTGGLKAEANHAWLGYYTAPFTWNQSRTGTFNPNLNST